MKLKLDSNGNVVVQDGMPVYVYPDGKEAAFDAAQTVSKITALNAEAKGHREAKEAAEAKLKAFDGITDADAARKAIDTMKNIKDGELITAGKVEEIKLAAKRAAEEQVAAAARTHSEELQGTKDALTKANNALHAEIIGGSFSRSKFITEKVAVPPDLLQAQFGGSFKVEEGKMVAYDGAGNRIFSRTRHGELANFDEAIETLIDQYPHRDHILKGGMKSGGGARDSGGKGGGNGGKTMTREQFDQTPHAERAAFFKEGGKVA